MTRHSVSLGRLAAHLEGKYLDEIDGTFVASIAKERRQAGASKATVKRDLGALSSVFNFATDEDWCDANPVLPRLMRIKEKRDPIVLPRPEDVDKIVARAPGMLKLMILAARVTGYRQEELARAEHRDLDRKARRLTVIGKRNKLRVIDLSPFDAYAVFDRIPEGVGKAPLFWHGAGERYENVSSRFAYLTLDVAAGDPDFIRFRFHDLRHLHAVEWLRSGPVNIRPAKATWSHLDQDHRGVPGLLDAGRAKGCAAGHKRGHRRSYGLSTSDGKD